MASPNDQTDPMATLRAFFALSNVKDVEGMRAMTHPSATACLIRHNEPIFMSMDRAIQNLADSDKSFREELWDEQVSVDGDFATILTKFRIYLDDKLHQTGTSLYSCFKTKERRWVILTMSDVARTPGE